MVLSSLTSPSRKPSTCRCSERYVPTYRTPRNRMHTASVIAVPHSVSRTPMVLKGMRALIFSKNIAHTANRVDQRPFKAVIHFLSKAVDVHVHDVSQGVLVHVPDMLEDHSSR